MDSHDFDGFRLSPQQKYVWPLQATNTACHAHCATMIEGALDATSFAAAIQQLVERHEALRTTFRQPPGMNLPLQVVLEQSPPAYRTVDLKDASAQAQAEAVSEIAAHEQRAPFDLEHGPVARFALLSLSAERHLFLVTLPALCADTWTLRNIIRELGELYRASLDGAALTDEPVQYVQFSEWLHELLEGEDAEAGRLFWQEQPAAPPVKFSLPFQADGAASADFDPADFNFTLDRATVSRIVETAERHDLSVSAFLFTCWQTLIRRLNNGVAVTLDFLYHGRKFEEVHGALGLFAKNLPVPLRCEDDAPFTEVWRQTASQLEELIEWQDYFIPARPSSENDLPDPVQFQFEERPASYRCHDLTFIEQEQHSHPARFMLKLSCAWRAEAATFTLNYNHPQFQPSDIERMAAQFQTLIHGVLENVAVAVGEADVLSPLERDSLEEARGDIHLAPDISIHRLFEQQVARTPDDIAAVFEDERLSYAALNRRANQLAHFLRGLGVGPEVLVGIFVERSMDMLVGLLGVLKAGGAYVPFDPKFPIERIVSVLEQGNVSLLLSQEHLLPDDGADQVRAIRLDSDWNVIAREPEHNPPGGASAGNTAYVSYTSGSTGRPKGVMIEHRQLLNYSLSILRRLNLPAGSSFATVSTIAADLGNTVIYPSLLSGGCLHIISWDRIFDTEALAAYFERHPADCLKIVPSHLKALLDGSRPQVIMPRQRLVLGGESFSWELAATLRSLAPDTTILNHYGPTETTVGVLTYQLEESNAPPPAATPPLGRPLDNIHVYILDARMRPQPAGLAGELYISGAGLARGYLGQPAATAEKFVPNPFSRTPGERMYRTGDVARRLRDGNIEFLGRGDNQIKVRGFRVELGEIESEIRRLPNIRDAVVLAHPDETSGKRIVAYLIPEGEYLETPQQELLAEQVAEWEMVFNETHSELSAQAQQATLNTLGWNSSYTGEPFAEDEIREQVESIVRRILAPRPARVLEIGCGAGLLLFSIAPHCAHYVGTDFSAEILSYTRNAVATSGLEPSRVTLLQRTADNFAELPAEPFDTVLLNSVIQYFPSIDYLLRVLEGALKVTRPGGSIFIGDVRSLPLLEAFHASVQLGRGADTTGRAQLQSLVQQQLERESELIIDPSFFYALRSHFPEIGHVEVSLKRGLYQNELTKFRYDVTLHVGPSWPEEQAVEWLDAREQDFTPAALREFLSRSEAEAVGLTGVPNARINADLHLLKLLSDPAAPPTIGELRQALQQQVPPGVHPEDFWALQDELPYAVEICWSRPGADDRFDVVFRRRKDGKSAEERAVVVPRATDAPRPWTDYANFPLREKLARNFISGLRATLEARMPDYMIPSSFVLLRQFPLTFNGKVDFHALALAEQGRPEMERPYVAPRTPVEVVVASVWASVLNLEQVGVHDNFFELGGHSLLATQVVARLRNMFQVNIPLRSFFELPTVAGFCAALTTQQENPGQIEKIIEILQRIESMSNEEVRQRL